METEPKNDDDRMWSRLPSRREAPWRAMSVTSCPASGSPNRPRRCRRPRRRTRPSPTSTPQRRAAHRPPGQHDHAHRLSHLRRAQRPTSSRGSGSSETRAGSVAQRASGGTRGGWRDRRRTRTRRSQQRWNQHRRRCRSRSRRPSPRPPTELTTPPTRRGRTRTDAQIMITFPRSPPPGPRR